MPVATGEVHALTSADRGEIERVVQRARDICGFEFAVFVGDLPDGRNSAVATHAGLHDPASAVLIGVDPTQRSIEIVTGSRFKRQVDDRTCEFAVMALRSCLQVDDLIGGLRDAVSLLAEHARAPRTLHADEPA